MRHVGPIDEKSLTTDILPALEEIIAAERALPLPAMFDLHQGNGLAY
ncbi:hypothetical protein ACC817_26275 [Rhizobium ruizarguesonis]|nr:hypothetical protein [Rhizobium ruizarguesonis]WSH65105.1 hypothetical protein U8Q05_00725 [Rhizobium ruizarguesonis]